MAETLKDFLVSVGFRVDEASQKKVEASVAQSEAKLTSATVKELDRRRAAEDKMLADRVNAIVATGGELDAEEKAAAARFLKTQQDTADKQKRFDEEGAKKTRERREKGWRDAQAFILKFAALATKAAVAVEAAALGVVYATDKAAKGFEQLNYAAQRIGSAPKSINAFTYAASQLGSSVGEAQGSLEKFGENLRRLPGFSGYIEGLGVRTRDAKGQMRDAADIATDLGTALGRIRDSDKRYGYTNAIARAASLGFDENTARALMDPAFARREGQYRADQARIGADPNAAAQAGTAFEQSMRHLEEVAESVATKVDEKLFQKIRPLLDQLAEWIAANGDKVATLVGRVADDLVKLASALGEAMGKIDWDGLLTKAEHAFTEFDRLARQYFGKDGLTTVFEAFGLVLAVNVLGKLTAMISALQTLSGIPLFTRLLTLLGVGGTAATAGLAAAALVASTTSLDGNADRNPGGVPGTGGFFTDPSGAQHSLRRVWDGVKRAVGAGRARLGDAIGIDDTPVPTGAHTPLKDLIAKLETGSTGASGYNTVYGHAERGGALAPPKPITQMTIGEILAYQHEMRPRSGASAFPVGRGQWVESTLRKMTRNMDPNTVFTPEVQERLLDRSIQNRIAQGPQGFRSEWDSFRGLSDARINEAIEGHRRAGSIQARDSKGNVVRTDDQGRAIGSDGKPTTVRPSNPFGSLDPNAFKSAPLGPSVSSMYQSYDNSRNRGDTTINAPQTFNIQGGDVKGNLSAARMAAGRGNPDWIRNLQSSEQ